MASMHRVDLDQVRQRQGDVSRVRPTDKDLAEAEMGVAG